jgi:hypothetical protein
MPNLMEVIVLFISGRLKIGRMGDGKPLHLSRDRKIASIQQHSMNVTAVLSAVI